MTFSLMWRTADVLVSIFFVLKQNLHWDYYGLVHSGTSIWGRYKLPEIAECGKLFYQNLCCILYSPLKEYPSNATGIQQGM